VIRQLMLSHLDPVSIEHQPARDVHSRYYLQFPAERESALRSASQQQAVRELLDEMANVRAAWIWAIRREMFAELGASVRSLAWFFEVTGLVREGIEQFEPLVRALRARPQDGRWQWLLGHTLTHQGMLYFRRGLFDRAQAQMEESLSILRSLGKQDYMTDVLVYLSIILHLNGDMQRSRALMEEGLRCAQATSNEWFLAYAIFNLGYLDSLEGKYEEGYRQMGEGVAIWRKLGDSHSISLGLNHLAPTLVKLGRYREAETGLQESLGLCTETGNRWGIGTGYRYLGLVKMAQGKLDQAVSLFQTSIETFGDYFTGWDIAKSWVFLAEAALRSGDLQQAQRAHRQALRLSREAESVPLMLDALIGLAQLDLKTGQHARAYEIAHLVLHDAASVQESKDRADQVRREAEKCIAREELALVRDQASKLTLDRTVSRFLDRP
jgi:tetratricopeptide (TPR) repeat protein